MKMEEKIEVKASVDEIWEVITDIEGSQERLSGIDKIEILEKPSHGMIGLKWRETRTLMGKEAEEIMWVIDEQPGQYYETEAHNHGMIYTSRMFIKDLGDRRLLGMSFLAEPKSVGARIMSGITGIFMKGAMRKVVRKDLEELKAAIELDG
jgi:hypothetical protein